MWLRGGKLNIQAIHFEMFTGEMASTFPKVVVIIIIYILPVTSADEWKWNIKFLSGALGKAKKVKHFGAELSQALLSIAGVPGEMIM